LNNRSPQQQPALVASIVAADRKNKNRFMVARHPFSLAGSAGLLRRKCQSRKPDAPVISKPLDS
jgi:hypothetical protein